jgi:hypothetical protein
MSKRRREAKPGSMEELATLYMPSKVIEVTVRRPEGDKIRLVKESIEVKPLDLLQTAAVARALMPIGLAGFASANLFLLPVLHLEETINAVAAAIGWSPANVARIDPVDFVKVYVAVMELNVDFLTRLPELLVFASPETAAAAGNGAGAEPSLSFGDTAENPTPKGSH